MTYNKYGTKSLREEELEGYEDILMDVKSILKRAKGRAYKAVDNIRVQAYWQTGERIVRGELQHKGRADYGKKIVAKLAGDLGFRERHVWRMVQFYRTYSILSSVMTELSWSHYVYLITIQDSIERRFYEIQSVREGWSVRDLQERIKLNEYAKAKKSGEVTIKIPLKLPSPEDVFKDAYDWKFLDIEKNHSERELEQSLLSAVEEILLEFGKGVAFMGSQQKILIAGQYHKVDLLFYPRFLKCLILVDLKIERFRREFIGQMNEYLTYYREQDKMDWERDPIGLIICKEKKNEEVHYALGKLREDIFVAEYRTQLPSEQEIRFKLQKQSMISKNENKQ